MNINRTFKHSVVKNELFSQKFYSFQNFRYETLKSLVLKTLSVFHVPKISFENRKQLKVPCFQFHASQNELI